MAKKSKINRKNICIFVITIIILIFFINFINKPKQKYNEKIVIILNNENITENLKDKILIKDSKIYMGFDDVKDFLDESLYFEEETGYIITTGNKKLAAFKQDDTKLIINGSNKECFEMLLNEDEKNYINISELDDVYNYEIKYINNTNIVTIDNLNKKSVKASIKRNANIKEDAKYFSKTIEKLRKKSKVLVISEENSYSKIRTENGHIGYIKKNLLLDYETLRDDYIEQTRSFPEEGYMNYDITKKDISNFEKRLNVINEILNEAVKKDKMYVKILFNHEEKSFEYERFKIESIPMLEECGIMLSFD